MRLFAFASIIAAVFFSTAQADSTREVDLGKTDYLPKDRMTRVDLESSSLSRYQISGFRVTALDATLRVESLRIRKSDGESKTYYFDEAAEPMGTWIEEGKSVKVMLRAKTKITSLSFTGMSAVPWGTEGRIEVAAIVRDSHDDDDDDHGGDDHYDRDSLYCKFNGDNNQPYYRKRDSFIGKIGYGFVDAKKCDEMVDASRHGIVCNWTGSGYSPYRISTGETAGKMDYGFSTSAACVQAINDSDGEFICNWTGSGYAPYFVKKYGNLGPDNYGMSKYSSCVSLIEGKKNGFMCNWNGSNYQPYSIRTNSGVGTSGYGFTNLSDCLSTVKNSTRRAICQWSGQGWGVYMTSDLSTPTRTYSKLQDCFDSIN